MTAKQALHERIETLTEDEACALLETLDQPGSEMEQAPDVTEAPEQTLFERIRALWAQVPEEDLTGIPSSDDVDKVVYGRP